MPVGAVGRGRHSLLVGDALLLLLELKVLLRVVVDVEAERGRVDVAVAPDQQSTEDRLGQDVEHAVESGFRVGRDKIAALAYAPSDGVQSPQDGGQ